MYNNLTRIAFLFLLTLLSACNEESTINKAKADFVAAKTKKAQQQAVAPLKKIAAQGNADIQAIYMVGSGQCNIITDKGSVSFDDLLNAGNKVAEFITYDTFWGSSPVRCRSKFNLPTRRVIHNKQILYWIQDAASQDYLPAKIAMARTYYYGSNIMEPDLFAAREVLREAVNIAENQEIDILQQAWSKQLLEDGFAEDIMQKKTKDPLLRINRLYLLTLLNPDWKNIISIDKHGEERINDKYRLIGRILHAKYQSINQLPYDSDAESSILIADNLLNQIQNQIKEPTKKEDDKLGKENHRLLNDMNSKQLQSARKKAEAKRQAFAKLKVDAENGNGEAMWKLYVAYKNLPAYRAETDQWLEAMMDLAKNTNDDRVVGIIGSHMLVKDDAKRMQLLRRCANFPNAKCMKSLASEIIFRDKDNYAEGIFWVYQAMAAGNDKAAALLKKTPRHKVGNWTRQFFNKGYHVEISDELACHAAQHIELKQESRKSSWSDSISPASLRSLYLRGAKAGEKDCISRLVEHYTHLNQNREADKWRAKLQQQDE